MTNQDRELPAWLATAIVLGPTMLWILALLIMQVAKLSGCKVWARGPEPCLVLGKDWGGLLYALWGVGFAAIYVLIWIPVGLLAVGLIRKMIKAY